MNEDKKQECADKISALLKEYGMALYVPPAKILLQEAEHPEEGSEEK